MMTASTRMGKTEKQMNRGQMREYCHESRMNHSVNRLPSRCKMICKRLNFAKTGGTLVPTSIKMNSRRQRLIMV